METQHRVLVIVLGIAAALVLFLWLQPKISNELAPDPVVAWVAVETAASGGVAVAGPVAIPSGEPFTLHAVLESEARGGRKVYYTQAKALRLPGGEVPAESLRPWDRPRLVKVRWFTVESRKPFVRLGEGEDPWAALAYEEVLRPEWPLAWSVPGSPGTARVGPGSEVLGLPEFGTRRFHVRIELYASEESLVPNERLRSWGAAELPARVEDFPGVVATLPGTLGPASKVFGLPQLGPAEGGDESSLQRRVAPLVDSGLAFTRLSVIRDQLRGSSRRLEELDWRWVELTGAEPWGEGVGAGDLLRVGERVVVPFEDRGEPGRLDYGDLAFDFIDGAAVRPLSDIFSGEGRSVRLASLGASPAR